MLRRDAYFCCFHAFSAVLLKDGRSLSGHRIIGRYALNKRARGVAVNHFTNIAAIVDDKTDSLNLIQLPNPIPKIIDLVPDTVFRGNGPTSVMIEGSGFI